jgi:2-haloacid dehalogenase
VTLPDAPRNHIPDDTPPIDTVVLDFGNVLVGWDPYAAYDGYMNPADVDAFFDEIGFHDLNRRQDGGRPWAEALAALGTTHPHRVEDLRWYVENYHASLTGPVEGTEELVHELKGLGLRLYGLTNWSAESFHLAEPAAPAIGLMDDVVVSGRVGLTKPDPRIFELVVERFGVDPSRAVFVDDSPANVTAARAVGFHGLVFTGTPALRRELRALGLPVAAPSGDPSHK